MESEAVERKRAALILADERNLLHTLIDALPDLIYVKDPTGHFVLNNRAHLRFLGLDEPGQAAGKTVFDLFPHELAQRYASDEERTARFGESIINEIEPAEDSSGNTRWLSITKVALKDSNSGLVGLVGIARDVTRRHQVEVSLRESEMLFRSVAQSACDAIVSTDAQGKIIFWNHAAETIFGYSKSEALAMRASSLILETESLETRRRELRARNDASDPHPICKPLELCGVKKDGTRFPIEVSLATWKTGAGQFYTKTIRDLTARKQAENALHAANETLEQKVAERSAAAEQRTQELTQSVRAYRDQTTILQSILDSMGDGVVVVDRHGIFVRCNPAAEELLGRTCASMVGQSWSTLYVPLMKDKITPIPVDERPLARAMRGESVNEAEVYLRPQEQRDGIWLSATARPLRDEDGSPQGGVLVFHDVTERKRSEAELGKAKDIAESANRAKSEFLANMSHELRTPMTAILGFADRMLAPNQGLSDLQNCVQIIRRNGQHLLNLINDILDISKIEAGQMTLEKISCDLPQLLADLRSLMRPRAIEKGLDFELVFSGALPRKVVTDPLRMKQILVNLIGNAIKFTPGGRIGLRVTCESAGESTTLQFEVSDTGIGMSDDQLSRLFVPFTQGDESTTRRFGGTGLGLTISRQLANLLGGDVVAKSKIGVGSTFTVSFQAGVSDNNEVVHNLIESELPAAVNIIAGRDMKLSGRILLAEDGRDNQRLLTEILTDAGAQVKLAENGRIAVDLALSQTFDLILMDMQMPELDGYGATAELRRKGSKLPIIALTAHAMAEDRDKCLASGCDGYLTKPIEIESFLFTVGNYLARAASVERPTSVNKGNAMKTTTGTIRSAYADMPKMRRILPEFVADLPVRVAEIKGRFSTGEMELVQRIAHQMRGAGGGYGFTEMSEHAAAVEQAVKDQQPRESIARLIDQLVENMRRIEGYQIESEQNDRPMRVAA